MKNLLLLFLLFTPLLSFSQEEYPIFSEDNLWYLKHLHIWNPPTYSTIQIIGDTIIDEKNYKILGSYPEDNPWGFFYDENKKSYFRYYDAEDSLDILLYDFNLEIGDTFNLPRPLVTAPGGVLFDPVIVEIVDTLVLSDGSLRKRIRFEAEYLYDLCSTESFHWIEGIGSNVHPFYPLFDCFEFGIEIDCYYYQGEELYGQCLYLPTNETDIHNIEIHPNPFTNEIKILDPNLQVTSCTLMGINGNKVATSTSNKLSNLEALPSGFYILQVELKDESKFIYRLVK